MPFSIVIPAFNEKDYILETIETVFKLLGTSANFELIVVDNKSTDGTAKILAEIDNIKVITLPEKVTVAQARNIGWRASSNFLVAFIDADMIVTDSWVGEIKKLQDVDLRDALMVTGCKCLPSRRPSWLERVWFTNENYRNHVEKYINSGNLITTMAVLKAINGFDESLITGEDVDFCMRAKKAGAALKINRGFQIYHEGYPKTLIAFLKRERWHGVGDFLSWKSFLGSKVAILSLIVSGLFVISVMLSFFGSLLFPIPLLLSLGLIVFSAHYKFKIKNFWLWPSVYVLQAIYFLGRTLSIFHRKKI